MGETDVSKFGMEALSRLDIRERHILVSYVQQAEAMEQKQLTKPIPNALQTQLQQALSSLFVVFLIL